MTEPDQRSERDLSEDQRTRLDAAHRDLEAAVTSYERFIGGALEAGEPVPAADADELRRAQEEVEGAERRLWQLREELLGWSRPPWAPSATLTADWFSAEDAIYDDVPETNVS